MNLGGRVPMPGSMPMSGAPGLPPPGVMRAPLPQFGGGAGGGMFRPGMTAPTAPMQAPGPPPMATAGQGMPMPNAQLPMAQQLARGLMQR